MLEESRAVFEQREHADRRFEAPAIRGLVADVGFDDFENGTLSNAVLPEHPATSGSANKSVAGKFGRGLRLTGDDPVTVPVVGRFPREQPFSASIWIRLGELTPKASILSRSGGGDDAAHLGYELVLLDGKPTASLIHFWPGNAIRIQAGNPLSLHEWHHVGVTYDGSSQAKGLRLYLNGDLLETEVVRDHLTRQITQWIGGREDLVIGQRYRDRGFKNGEVDVFKLYDRTLSHREMQLLAGVSGHGVGALADPFELVFGAQYPPLVKAREALQAARRSWNQVMDAIPDISIMRELPEPRPTYVLQRGAYDAHGERVTPNTPSALPSLDHESLPPNRLGLAEWLTDPGHPLFSRVTVNRYWQMIFGEGLVRTPEDFGVQGARPTHPELLDWLARDFMNHDWDLHHLFKQMVLSATYRQSTLVDSAIRQRDPENLFLARGHGKRLPAEMIRDHALFASGLLVDRIGGPPAKPYEVEVSFSPVKPDQGDGLYRRSLYTWWKRNAPAPMMVTFDAPKRDVCAVKREPTASPIQSLVLLNGPQFVEAARVLSVRLLREYGSAMEELVEVGFRTLTSRKPDPHEARILLRLYSEQLQEFQNHPEAVEALLGVGQASLPEDLGVLRHQLAAVTVLLNSIMSLDESIHQR